MFLWRAFAGVILGAALTVIIWLIVPLTVLGVSLAGTVLTVAGLIAGGVMDIRADRRRDYNRGDQQ